ncbi:MAG: phage integrase family protein [Marmoricola sp.]|nr:phage integrase family protein [Marmoricola sp.]
MHGLNRVKVTLPHSPEVTCRCCAAQAARYFSAALGDDDLLFATRAGTPISRNTFRTRAWAPAVKASGIDFNVRIHDLRHAHASWLLAGGADLKSVTDRMGQTQIQTTQRYLHALPDADQRNLDAFTRIAGQRRLPPSHVEA